MLTPFATKIFMIVLTVAILIFILIKGWHHYLFDFYESADPSDVNDAFLHDKAIREVLPMLGLLPISFLALFGTTKLDIKWKIFDAFLHIFMFVASILLIRYFALQARFYALSFDMVCNIRGFDFIYTYGWLIGFVDLFFIFYHFLKLYGFKKEKVEKIKE